MVFSSKVLILYLAFGKTILKLYNKLKSSSQTIHLSKISNKAGLLKEFP